MKQNNFKLYRSLLGTLITLDNQGQFGTSFKEVQIKKLGLNDYQVVLTDGYQYLSNKYTSTIESAKKIALEMINNKLL